MFSDSPTLRGTAAVVRNRRHILDRLDLETRRGERLNGRLAATARALHTNVHTLHTSRQGLASALLSRHRGSERRALLGALEASLAARSPRNRVSTRIGDRDGRIVEGRIDVG